MCLHSIVSLNWVDRLDGLQKLFIFDPNDLMMPSNDQSKLYCWSMSRPWCPKTEYLGRLNASQFRGITCCPHNTHTRAHTRSALSHKGSFHNGCFSHFSFTPASSGSLEEKEPSASHYTYGKYVRLNSTLHEWKMSRFFNKCQWCNFEQVVRVFEVWQITWRHEPRDTWFPPPPSICALTPSISQLKNNDCDIGTFSYHRRRSTWNQGGGRKVCSDGCYWPILSLSQQTVYVTGQTGGGAHCMVPQNEDCIIQPVQTILHSGLEGPQGLESEGLGREEGQSSLV